MVEIKDNKHLSLELQLQITVLQSKEISIRKIVKEYRRSPVQYILAKYHGDDPVMIKLPRNDGYSTRIMTSPLFWVNTSNDLVNNLKQVFPDKVEVKIGSLDKPLET